MPYKQKETKLLWRRAQYQTLRDQVFKGYGAVCVCCGEADFRFLSIDHVDGGGSKERKQFGRYAIFKKILEKDFPKEYQILCYNCNQGRYRNGGTCPHKENNEDVATCGIV